MKDISYLRCTLIHPDMQSISEYSLAGEFLHVQISSLHSSSFRKSEYSSILLDSSLNQATVYLLVVFTVTFDQFASV